MLPGGAVSEEYNHYIIIVAISWKEQHWWLKL
jgi:hypothetical protein